MKDQNKKVKCEICDREFKSLKALSIHLSKCHHENSQSYYDKYFLQDNSDKNCLNCGKKTSFQGLIKGYARYCSPMCVGRCELSKEKSKKTNFKKYGCEYSGQSSDVKKKRVKTCRKRYGVDNVFQVPENQETYKRTCLKKFGAEYPNQCEEVKEKRRFTCRKRYGMDNIFLLPEIQEKIKQTNYEKYGVEYPFQLLELQEKYKRTCQNKYGVDHPTKTPEARHKSRLTAIKRINHQCSNGEPSTPNIGKNERICLNELELYCKLKIERNSQIIGFFPDGRIDNLKILLEFDESHHFKSKDGDYIDKDVFRQGELEKEGYEFFRIKQTEWLENPRLIKLKFKQFVEERIG